MSQSISEYGHLTEFIILHEYAWWILYTLPAEHIVNVSILLLDTE